MGLSKQCVRRVGRSKWSALVATGVVVGAMAAIAIAATPTAMKGTARVSGKSRSVVVDSRGQTLYALSGERVGNLKCINQTCFSTWLPYKVMANQSLTRGAGVTGTLSKLQRVRARFFQVMLGGRPLYRYAGDNNSKGSAKGQGSRSFGGTWGVVST